MGIFELRYGTAESITMEKRQIEELCSKGYSQYEISHVLQVELAQKCIYHI
jgi:SOS response regulatory protein OraA/RecX